MTTLTGKKIANTYKDLLQVSNSNAGVDGTLRTVEDGEGTNTPLQLSNSAVNINGPSALQLNGVTLTATASVLNAVADLTGANGMVAVSGGQVYGRTLVGSTGIVITNDKGTEGNPTFTIATSIATSADVSALETSIANSNAKIAIVSALTSVNKAAITSINTVIDNLDYATSAELAAVSSALATSIANHLRLSGGTLTGQLTGTSATFSGAVCATTFYGNGSNLTGITASIPASTATSAQLASVSSRITSVSNFAVNLSATFATSINNSNTVIAAVSALTSVNKAAITSINTVIDNLDFATSAELANVSSTLATSIANHLRLSGGTLTGQLTGTSATFSGAVCATSYYGDGSNLTGITVSLPTSVVTSAQFASVSSRITSVSNFAVNLSATFATSIDNSNTAIAAVSALTSVNKAAITSINTVIDNLDYATSAELATVSALTSVNKAAITSINTVIDNLDYATSAELAAVSSTLATSIANHLPLSGGTLTGQLTGTSATFSGAVCATTYYGSGANLTGISVSIPTSVVTSAQFASVSARITSVSNFAVNLSATFATSINNSNNTIAAVSALTSVNKAAITSINTVIDNLDFATSAELATVSSTLATSIANHLRLSGGTLTGQLAGTSATFSGAVCATTFYGNGSNLTNLPTAPTSVSAYTVNQLTVVSNGTFNGPVSGTSAIFTGIVSANEFDALIGSFSTSVSIGANLNVVGAVSGTSAIFTGVVSANEFDALIGSFSTSVSIGANLNVTGAVSGTSGVFTGIVSVNEIDASIGSFNGAVSVGGAINVVGAVSGTSGVFTGIVSTSAVFDGKGELRLIPPNSQSTAYTLLATDAGKVITTTSGGVTVPQNIFVAGNAISIYNNSANNQTITQGTSVTMYLGGTATTGNRTLAQRGIATILCVTSNIFVISGAGLT